MAKERRSKRLHVINPGFDRYGLDSPSGPEIPINIFLGVTPQGKLEDSVWPTLQWWESQLQAEVGINALRSRPFLHLTKEGKQSANVYAHQIYADVLDTSDTMQVKAAAKSVAMLMRQGRELYTAAGSPGITDLSTPLLYYYGALAFAKAAIAAVFGVWNQTGEQHGLAHAVNRPTSQHPLGLEWPTVIVWHKNGVFRRLYRTARYDEVWQKWPKLGLPGSTQFHVLECIRYLSGLGILMPTGFAKVGFPPPSDYRALGHPREKCLLTYQAGGDLFMHLTTSAEAPVFQLPNIIVQFMLLHYFSTLARYHTDAWQALLSGADEPEGVAFRVALQDIAGKFLREVKNLLPLPDNPITSVPDAQPLPTPLPGNWIEHWYSWPEEPVA